MRQQDTCKLRKIGIYNILYDYHIESSNADLGILLNCTTYLFHSNSAFHLPAGSNEERNGQESSVDKEVAALQQALAMMQMENIPVNGSAEETGTKKKAGIATIARYPYFTLGVEVAVLLIL